MGLGDFLKIPNFSPLSRCGNLTTATRQSLHWQQLLEKVARPDWWSILTPHVGESGFWKPWQFCLWNPESWVLDSGFQFKDSSIQSRMQFPLRLESSTWNQESMALNSESKTVLDSLGFPYMERILVVLYRWNEPFIREIKQFQCLFIVFQFHYKSSQFFHATERSVGSHLIGEQMITIIRPPDFFLKSWLFEKKTV